MKKDFFIGIDSDGTAFNSMEIKHKKCFIPAMFEIWSDLDAEASAAAEKINLYSTTRGINRFSGLLLLFKSMQSKGIDVPEYSSFEKFMNSGTELSNDGLEQYLKNTNDSFLKEVLLWSKKSDEKFKIETQHLKPFKYVENALKTACKYADIAVISSASYDSLKKSWREGGIIQYVSHIMGQEQGSKTEQLKKLAQNSYNPDKTLMIGDAPGDIKSAKAVGALFYPILTNHEENSWKMFCDTAFEKFIAGAYKGDFENRLISDFNSTFAN